eukprot:COSAG06_NODE_872_length_11850_cov_8.563952_15_plen_59_part_00
MPNWRGNLNSDDGNRWDGAAVVAFDGRAEGAFDGGHATIHTMIMAKHAGDARWCAYVG